MGENNRPVFKYLTWDGFIKTLEGHSLLWRHPSEFNDPFDCYVKPAAQLDTAVCRDCLLNALVEMCCGRDQPKQARTTSIINIVNAIRDRPGRPSPDRVRSELRPLIEGVLRRVESEPAVHDGEFDRVFETLRVCCYSSVNDDLLMWSHYADCHKGAVIQFVPRSDDSMFKAVRRVRYDRRPAKLFTERDFAEFMAGRIASLPNDFIALATTKATVWKYEQEVRHIWLHPEKSVPKYLAFHQSDLAAVYLGSRVNQDQQKAAILLLEERYPGAKCHVASMRRAAFGLEFRPV